MEERTCEARLPHNRNENVLPVGVVARVLGCFARVRSFQRGETLLLLEGVVVVQGEAHVVLVPAVSIAPVVSRSLISFGQHFQYYTPFYKKTYHYIRNVGQSPPLVRAA